MALYQILYLLLDSKNKSRDLLLNVLEDIAYINNSRVLKICTLKMNVDDNTYIVRYNQCGECEKENERETREAARTLTA